MQLQDASLQVYKKTLSHILFHMFLIFSECITITSSEEALKLGIRKISPQKIARYENTHMKASPVKIIPQKFAPEKIPPYENSPPEKITPNDIPTPLIDHTNERKNKIKKIFALRKAVEHSILIKTTKVLFDTQMILQKILGLDTFFTEWRKSKNPTKAKIAKWHLLDSCTSQGEPKIGSQTVKIGKYVKLLNSQLSFYITLWIFLKKQTVKCMH